jgi:hypothetical protein
LTRPGPTGIATALRRRYERVKTLSPEAQIRDLVDYLENPEVLVAEFVDAYCAIEGCADADELILEGLATRPRGPLAERFASGRAVQIAASDEPALRCLAGPVPLLADAEDASGSGLDFVAVVPGVEPVPVLGVIEWPEGTSCYVLLMRALCCLAELAPAAHLERVSQELFKDALGAQARFDLQLVMQGSPGGTEARTLAQLTRDLAEGFHQALADEWQFPDLLRRIACLRAPSAPAPLEVDWIA